MDLSETAEKSPASCEIESEESNFFSIVLTETNSSNGFQLFDLRISRKEF